MSQKNLKQSSFLRGRRPARVLTAALLVAVLAVGTVPRLVAAVTCSSTADCQAQINNLSNQNASAQQTIGTLQGQAASYQAAVDQLQSQISALQSQLVANQAKQASLKDQIAANEAEIAAKKSTLSDDVKTMYVSGQMSTIEQLATSKDLSDYVDKQEYQTAVQNQLSDIIKQINALQVTLEAQKAQVDGLVSTEQTENTQLASAQAQQQQLLNYNESQQAAYNQQIATDNSNISALKARLAALNTVSGQSVIVRGTCGGGYPSSATSKWGNWGCNYAQDNTFDNWGMYNRECVSYTAYMAYSQHGVSTYDWGNAYQWIASAENAGYTVDQTPAVGAVAIRNIDYSEPGDVGHAMYVTGVNGDGTITVQEYNEYYNGTYDERTFDPSSYASRGGMYYIHFN